MATYKTKIAVKFLHEDEARNDQGMFFATHASEAVRVFDEWCVNYLAGDAAKYAKSVGEDNRRCIVIGALLINEENEAIAYWNPVEQRARRILR